MVTQLGQVRAGLSRHGEHPGVTVGMAERHDGLACWQLLLTVSGSSANLWWWLLMVSLGTFAGESVQVTRASGLSSP
jgi:hypothetical protein